MVIKTEDELVAMAKEIWAGEDLQVLEDAKVAPMPDGTWVQVWVWVEATTQDQV